MTLYRKKTFTLLLVDDNLSAIMPQIDEIESYLNDEGIELVLLTDDKSGKKVDLYLEEYDVDVIVTDNKMGHDGDGLKVVKNVRKKNNLIDILFYSANSLDKKDYEILSSYTSVEIVPTKQIVDHLESLIDKILSNYIVEFSEEENDILKNLLECNLCAENLQEMKEDKIFSIITEILSLNSDFSLADLWNWISENVPEPNEEVLGRIAGIFGKASFDKFIKYRYYCTNCNKKYSRWPNVSSDPSQELKCLKCGQFDSVRKIQ